MGPLQLLGSCSAIYSGPVIDTKPGKHRLVLMSLLNFIDQFTELFNYH